MTSTYPDAFVVLDELRDRHIDLRVERDDRLSFSPRDAVDGALRAAIVKHKPALIHLLSQTPRDPDEDAVRQRERELRERLPETTRNGGHIMLRAVRPGDYAAGICITYREPAAPGWMRCQVCAEAARRVVAKLLDDRQRAAARTTSSSPVAEPGVTP